MTNPGPREEILRLFREKGDSFLSGEEISQFLGVSRSAVWKQIKLLRELGYRIEAVTSRGYRLLSAPDELISSEIQADLNTRCIGREVVWYEQTDSTNLRAYDLGEQGRADGTVVLADSQSAGKGRMGRRWESPAVVNLYTSVLLRPAILPRYAPQLTFVSAAAVALAVQEISGLDPQVKWPNDILLGGKKVAGLLNEMSAETEGIHFVILGIGVNLNMTADQFPDDLRYPATSLLIEKGQAVSRLAFARCLYRHLDELYHQYLAEGFAPIRQQWESFWNLNGRRVEVDYYDRKVQGQVTGLDPDGALLLRLDDGCEEKVLAGDVRPIGPEN